MVYHHGSTAGGGHYTVAVARHYGGSNANESTQPAGLVNGVGSTGAAANGKANGALTTPSSSSSWMHFDDESVSAVPLEQVIVSPEEAASGRIGSVGGRDKCAYLLFYQRVR